MKETQQRGGAGLVLAGASLWGLIGLFNRALLGSRVRAGEHRAGAQPGRPCGAGPGAGSVGSRETFRVQGKHLGVVFRAPAW